MKEEERGTAVGLQVSGEWRKRHEERMQTVGVVRGVVIERKERKERKEVEDVKKTDSEKPLEKVNSLGEGWEW